MFEQIIGNNQVKEYLTKTINNKKIPHSYIFSGIKGIGKKQFAREYAKNIMCLEGGNCGDKCDSCKKLKGNNNPDYFEIEPETNTIKIDQIRKMQEKIAEKPITSHKKIYIIDDVELLTEESQNCLLKTLEEPPEYVIIILIVSNESKILATIKSRCVTVKFNKIPEEELHKALENFNEEQIKLLNGSFENLEKIEQIQEQYKNTKKIVDILKNGTLLELMEKSEFLYEQKENIEDILDNLNILLMQNNLIDTIKFVEKTKKKIKSNNNYEMSIDYLLLNIWNNH